MSKIIDNFWVTKIVKGIQNLNDISYSHILAIHISGLKTTVINSTNISDFVSNSKCNVGTTLKYNGCNMYKPKISHRVRIGNL